jgi:hypothetical protein
MSRREAPVYIALTDTRAPAGQSIGSFDQTTLFQQLVSIATRGKKRSLDNMSDLTYDPSCKLAKHAAS